MRGKYLSVFGDYTESIYAYMEKMANWGYLRCTKSSPDTRKVFKNSENTRKESMRTWRRRKETLDVFS
jgi:hypothetical protein